MSKTIILAIKYAEPEWQQTLSLLLKQTAPVLLIDRAGVESLAEAINRGVKELAASPAENIWVVTNVLFQPDMLSRLEASMEQNNCDAVHPCFKSDHAHLQPSKTGEQFAAGVPFIEFTAPLIKKQLLQQFTLDEGMPYWGHDLDWGYRVSVEHKYVIGVDYNMQLLHTYIRHNKFNHPTTLIRRKKRIATNESTTAKLVEKYGEDWKTVLKYKE